MHEKKNNNSTAAEEDIDEYIDILMDALRHRTTPKQIEHYERQANCISELINVIKKYKIKDIDEVVHVLTSVIIMPIMMLEPDPMARVNLMKEFITRMASDITKTLMKDLEMKNTEQGREVERLRNMIVSTNLFDLKKKNDNDTSSSSSSSRKRS